ncbi:hypothetical protein [Fimbriiglobus ruber]|uniref:Leucine-rich repeat domain protein n=1 Tax=Fimbriiglobus ruber TaxID=1908690 RepID=A0A225DK43_9BACT|nr:hypothetical protein [Fimbriiglobus ruber]OWK36527.1 Leucine-rich repeat domain protein [Fimbriiglobus ruber]
MYRSTTLLAVACLVVFPAVAAAQKDGLDLMTRATMVKIGATAEVDKTLDKEARLAVKMPTATNADLLALCKLQEVGAITIDDATKCTEKGFEALKELPDLQRLVLSRSIVGDKEGAVIGSIRTLQVVYLGESRISDAGLAGFAKNKNLQALDLLNTKVTDKGLAHLAHMTKLEDLNLAGTRVSDAGITHLKGMTGLKLLRLNNSNVTRAGVTELEQALPKATVRW